MPIEAPLDALNFLHFFISAGRFLTDRSLMPKKLWDPEHLQFEFPDVSAYEGPIDKMPFMHRVEKVRLYLTRDILGEVQRCLQSQSELAALLITLAIVDYLSGFYIGHLSKRHDFIAFMQRYFPPEYDRYVEAIYDQLRCGLMHNLTALNPWKSNTIRFDIHSNSGSHLAANAGGPIVFSVAHFARDTHRAWIMYSHDLIMNPDRLPSLTDNFSRRFGRVSCQSAFMQHIPD